MADSRYEVPAATQNRKVWHLKPWFPPWACAPVGAVGVKGPRHFQSTTGHGPLRQLVSIRWREKCRSVRSHHATQSWALPSESLSPVWTGVMARSHGHQMRA